jgi:hypothetical protein
MTGPPQAAFRHRLDTLGVFLEVLAGPANKVTSSSAQASSEGMLPRLVLVNSSASRKLESAYYFCLFPSHVAYYTFSEHLEETLAPLLESFLISPTLEYIPSPDGYDIFGTPPVSFA